MSEYPAPVPDGRTFTSTLLLVAGPVGAALGWLALNDVGAATVFSAPPRFEASVPVRGLLVGCWPWVVPGLMR